MYRPAKGRSSGALIGADTTASRHQGAAEGTSATLARGDSLRDRVRQAFFDATGVTTSDVPADVAA